MGLRDDVNALNCLEADDNRGVSLDTVEDVNIASGVVPDVVVHVRSVEKRFACSTAAATAARAFSLGVGKEDMVKVVVAEEEATGWTLTDVPSDTSTLFDGVVVERIVTGVVVVSDPTLASTDTFSSDGREEEEEDVDVVPTEDEEGGGDDVPQLVQ